MPSHNASPPELAVIIPVFNGEVTLAEQLDALEAQEWDGAWEIVVVDNGSTDSTPGIIEQYRKRDPRLRCVPAPDAHNLSYVRNVGVNATTARSVAFADADDIVGDGWLAAVGAALRKHDLVAYRLEYERLNGANRRGRKDFQASGIEELFGQPVANGAMGCRRDLWLALGGNDEGLEATGEDFDFSLRAHRYFGIQPHFADGAVYHYRRRPSATGTLHQAKRYGRSHALLYRRYGRGSDPAWRRTKVAIAAYLRLAARWPRVRRLPDDDPERIDWSWRAGIRLGRLQGSLREHVYYP